MTGIVFAAAWPARRETLAESASRVLDFTFRVREIGAFHRLRWFELGASRKHALARPIASDLDGIATVLDRGRNRRDVDKSVIEQLGFSFDAWSADSLSDATVAKVRIVCGAWADMGGTAPNSINLSIRGASLDASAIGVLVHSAALAFDAPWAVAGKQDWISERLAAMHGLRRAIVGSVTYLGIPVTRMPVIPADLIITPVGDGVLLRMEATDDAISARAEGILEGSGMLPHFA